MAAPNTLIINSRTIVDASHIIRAAQIYGDSVVQVGNTAMYTGSFVTPYITTNTLQLNGTATITGNANVSGTVTAAGFSTTGTTTTGNITLNGTLSTGNVTFRNNYIGVGRSTIEDGGINTPYALIHNLNVPGTTTTGTVTTTFLNTSNSTVFNGQVYYNVGNYINHRNPANGVLWAVEGVQTDGLYFFNINNTNGTFKYTLFRTSAGPSTSDPGLTIGVTTRVVGNMSADSNINAGGSATVGGNLQVNGSSNINGSQTVGGQTIMQNFEARNDSRIYNGGQPYRGVLYFGNGDKYLTWDGSNWIMRGGSLYVSRIQSDGDGHISGGLQVNGFANINGNVGIGGYCNPNTITTVNWIRTGAEIRITGYGSGGLLRMGTTDSVYMLYDAGRFVLNGGNIEVSNDVYANSVIVRGGNLITHRNSAYGILYFGNGYNSWLEYNGAGLLSVPHDFQTGGTLRGVGVSVSGDANSNRTYANFIRSHGNMEVGGLLSVTDVVNAGRLHSWGNIGANGVIGAPMLEASHHIINSGVTYFRGGSTRWGGDDGIYINGGGGWISTNGNFRTDGAGQIRAGGDLWSVGGALITGSSQEMVLRGEPWSKNGVIFTTSTKLVVENVYCYTLNYQSDITMKDVRGEFMPDAEALDKITQLQPIKYTWKPEVRSDSGILHYGFSAQQVQEVLPDLVTENSEKLSVAHIEMLPLMVASIRELKREVEELRAQLASTVPMTVLTTVPKTETTTVTAKKPTRRKKV